MEIPPTFRRRLAPVLALGLLLAATLASTPAHHQRPGPRTLVNSTGHRAAAQELRAAAPFACILPATYALPAHAASPLLSTPSNPTRSLDRVELPTGRSPPPLS